MFWIFLLVLILVVVLYSAWKFGLFEKFAMEKGRLMACQILYLPYKGDYQKIGPLFEQVSRNTNAVFKFSQNFGFYYDDPATTPQQYCRAIVGILINQGQQFKIKQFISQFPGYKHAHLDTTRHIFHEMPFVNMLSILLMVKTVYPKIQQYLKKSQVNESELFGMMEIYKWVSAQKKIQIMVPLNNKQQFLALIEGNKKGEGEDQQEPKMNVQ